MNPNLMLQSGQCLALSHIEQWRTYEGLLCGQPAPARDDEKMQVLLDRARRQGGAAVLVQPPPGDCLPPVCCVATFDSARPDSGSRASVGVAWFQDDFALPIDERVMALIGQVAWDGLATEW
jgi:hypothetical protein